MSGVKYIFNTASSKNTLNLPQVLEFTNNYGFDGVELDKFYIQQYFDEGNNKASLVSLLYESKLDIPLLSTEYDFLSSSGGETEKAEKDIQLAAELGISSLRILSSKLTDPADISEDEYDTIINSIIKITKCAYKNNINIICEPEKGQLHYDMQTTLKISNKVYMENFKILFDIWYMNLIAKVDPMLFYSMAKDKIDFIRVRNINPETEESEPLENSDFDFKEIIDFIKKKDFAGYISYTRAGEQNTEQIEKDFNYIKKLFEGEAANSNNNGNQKAAPSEGRVKNGQ